jgi:hypothetical protein
MKNVSFEMMHSSLWETRRQVCIGVEDFFRANLCHFLPVILSSSPNLAPTPPPLILVSLRALSPFLRS